MRPWGPHERERTPDERGLDVSDAVNDAQNLDAVGQRAIEDEIALKTLDGPDADGGEARIPKAPLRAQFGYLG